MFAVLGSRLHVNRVERPFPRNLGIRTIITSSIRVRIGFDNFMLILRARECRDVDVSCPMSGVETSLSRALICRLSRQLLLTRVTRIGRRLIPRAKMSRITYDVFYASSVRISVPPMFVHLAARRDVQVVEVRVPWVVYTTTHGTQRHTRFCEMTIMYPIDNASGEQFTEFYERVFIGLEGLRERILRFREDYSTILRVRERELSPMSLT